MLSMKAFEKKYGVRFTMDHSGKMDGMYSLSTSPFNRTCDTRAAIPGSICSDCYSRRLVKARNMGPKLEKNAEVLSSIIIPLEDIPIINALYFRYEAFGEITSTTQAINYTNIAKMNPRTTFGSWTKNPGFYAQAIRAGYEIPENLVIGLSVLQEDVKPNLEAIKRLFPFIRFVFTVYTKEYAAAHNITINCGSRHCLSCLRCYLSPDGIQAINELKK